MCISIAFCSTSRTSVGCLYDNLRHFLTHRLHPERVCWIWIRWAPSPRSGALSPCRARVQRWRIPVASRTTASRTAPLCLPLSAWNSKSWFENHIFILQKCWGSFFYLPLAIHCAERDAPKIRTKLGEMWNVFCNLKKILSESNHTSKWGKIIKSTVLTYPSCCSFDVW